MGSLTERLVALGVPSDLCTNAEACCNDLSEALELLGRLPDGTLPPWHNKWQEYYSVESARYYYCNNAMRPQAYNSWDSPPCFRFTEWRLDCQLFPGLPICKAKQIYLTLDALLLRHAPNKVEAALRVLSKVVGNVADCSNTIERYRCIKPSNPTFQQAVWDVAGAPDLLLLLGWQHQGQTLSQPASAALPPIQAAASRLRRLLDRKGHSGQAIIVQPPSVGSSSSSSSGSMRPQSVFYGRPGYLYQEQIWHCSVCDHAINDGSERLFTRRHEAPHGEYRYTCTSCEAGHFNLCEGCWDRFQSGQDLHPRTHAFQHIGPRLTRHNDYYANQPGGSSSNNGNGNGSDPGSSPWGHSRAAIGSYGRALQRLGTRYGISNWG